MKVKLLLMSKKQKLSNGKSFKKFFTYMDIEVKGEEEKGLQLKSITVLFDEKVDTKNFTRGILTVEENDMDIPYRYEIKEVTKKDGTTGLSYPHIYIKKVISYEERKPKSTGQFNLMDEAETEETEIDNEDIGENTPF